MSVERQTPTPPRSAELDGRDQTPSPAGYRRSTRRSSTLNNKDPEGLNRRASFFSDTFSDTHKSFRTSTDDLLLPRVSTTAHDNDEIETSHWHSVPLFLALLPAVGGLFFKDGSSIITDITLLGLAAIFLNWALRLPWEWYKAAQATVEIHIQPQKHFSVIEEEDEDAENVNGVGEETDGVPNVTSESFVRTSNNEDMQAAQQELRMHQLAALAACFLFPLLGAWLLHAIRSQLSRPSEGLVSNYNLTIFLLVAEIRPLSHSIKLVQRRTLFLQRKVNSQVLHEQQVKQGQDMIEVTRRLEELEAHIANIEAMPASVESLPTNGAKDAIVSQATSQATVELRKNFQPELDALSRAMRRYEKRMTITAIQVESRLQDLETRLREVVSLAAAAQRNADKNSRNYFSILVNWICAIIVVPTQYMYRIVKFPAKLAQNVLDWVKTMLGLSQRYDARSGKGMQRQAVPRARGTTKKGKATTP